MRPAAPSDPDRDLSSAEQDEQVVALKRQGLSFVDIGEVLGISKSQAHRAFHRALKRIPAEEVQAYRDEQLQQIALAREVVLDILGDYVKNIVVSHDGDVIENGEDHGPALGAVDRLVKLADHEAKLLGLYAEKKISMSGALRYEVAGINPDLLR